VPIFMVERNYAEQLEPSFDAADGINRLNAEEGVRWLYSFLSADRRKTYCLYESPSPEAIRTAAARAGLPADVIVEVSDRLMPNGATAEI
jgi:Nickel responsive protein SCO4226-like